MRGELLANNADYQKAIDDMTKVINLAPANYGAYAFRDQLQKLSGNKQQAISDLRTALEGNLPADPVQNIKGQLDELGGR